MKLLPTLESISPRLVAKLGYRAFNNPQVKKYRPFEKAINDQAEKSFMDFQGGKIARYTWGEGEKTALLVHGWEGRASNFGQVIPRLLEKGYRVIGFDAPGHGQSGRAKNPFKTFLALIHYMLQEESYDLLVSHSAGSALTIWGLQKLDLLIPQVIICTVPDRLEDRFQMTIDQLGLGPRTKELMMQLFKAETGLDAGKLVTSQLVREIRFDTVLFISDVNDRVLPLDWTQAVQRSVPNSELMLLNNTGHFRMLWSDQLEKIIIDRVK